MVIYGGDNCTDEIGGDGIVRRPRRPRCRHRRGLPRLRVRRPASGPPRLRCGQKSRFDHWTASTATAVRFGLLRTARARTRTATRTAIGRGRRRGRRRGRGRRDWLVLMQAVVYPDCAGVREWRHGVRYAADGPAADSSQAAALPLPTTCWGGNCDSCGTFSGSGGISSCLAKIDAIDVTGTCDVYLTSRPSDFWTVRYRIARRG